MRPSEETKPVSPPATLHDLADLCRLHDVVPELMERADSVEGLIEAILDAYERRRSGSSAGGPETPAEVRALVAFAAQASAIKVQARRSAQDESNRVERLEEVLRTVEVLCHKINNPLTAILGRAQLLRLQADADPGSTLAVRGVEESAQRVAELVRELATLAKEVRGEAGSAARPTPD